MFITEFIPEPRIILFSHKVAERFWDTIDTHAIGPSEMVLGNTGIPILR